MKTYHTSLRSNWKTPFAHGKMPARLPLHESRLEKMQGTYTPSGLRQRIANVKKVRGGFKVTGIEKVVECAKGEFEIFKAILRGEGFTGMNFMGRVSVI